MKALLILFVIFLFSCSNHSVSDSVFMPYLSELGINVNETTTNKLEKYPRKRDLLLRPEQERLSFVDMFKLPCGLGDLVADRNSALGKVMPESRIYIYEMNFISQTKKCLQGNSINNDKIKDQLEQILKSKSNNLKSYYWNATFAGPEFSRFFSSSGKYNPEKNSQFLKEAITYFNQNEAIEKGNMDGAAFEFQLEQLGKNPYAYAFLNELHQTTIYLNLVTEFLNSKSNGSNHLQVFRNHYPQKIQPYISELHQTGSKFIGDLTQFYREFEDIAPSSVQQYFTFIIDTTNAKGLWRQFDQAINNHTTAWQPIVIQSIN